jgi:hypothetical protein
VKHWINIRSRGWGRKREKMTTTEELAGSYRFTECGTMICVCSATKNHYLLDTATNFYSIKREQWESSKYVFKVMNQTSVTLHGIHPIIIQIL